MIRLFTAAVHAVLPSMSLAANPTEPALVGGTVVDVDNFGETTAHLVDSTVLIHDQLITAPVDSLRFSLDLSRSHVCPLRVFAPRTLAVSEVVTNLMVFVSVGVIAGCTVCTELTPIDRAMARRILRVNRGR